MVVSLNGFKNFGALDNGLLDAVVHGVFFDAGLDGGGVALAANVGTAFVKNGVNLM
jgi:hypothetical protein